MAGYVVRAGYVGGDWDGGEVVVMTKLILEYVAEGIKQRMVLNSCTWHRIDKCIHNNRHCDYPKLDVPNHCHIVGHIVCNGVITRGKA